MEQKFAMELSKKVDEIHLQMGVLSKTQDEMSKGQSEMQRQVSELYSAFTGNSLGQKGLVPRVETLELEYQKLSKFKTKVVGIAIGVATVWTVIIEIFKNKIHL